MEEWFECRGKAVQHRMPHLGRRVSDLRCVPAAQVSLDQFWGKGHEVTREVAPVGPHADPALPMRQFFACVIDHGLLWLSLGCSRDVDGERMKRDVLRLCMVLLRRGWSRQRCWRGALMDYSTHDSLCRFGLYGCKQGDSGVEKVGESCPASESRVSSLESSTSSERNLLASKCVQIGANKDIRRINQTAVPAPLPN